MVSHPRTTRPPKFSTKVRSKTLVLRFIVAPISVAPIMLIWDRTGCEAAQSFSLRNQQVARPLASLADRQLPIDCQPLQCLAGRTFISGHRRITLSQGHHDVHAECRASPLSVDTLSPTFGLDLKGLAPWGLLHELVTDVNQTRGSAFGCP